MNKQILRLALPFIISNLTVPLVSSVDTALMGHYGSIAHLGAIGLGGAIFNFLYWNFAFIRMSVVGLTAQALGKKNNKDITVLLGRSMLIAAIGAILLLLFQKPIETILFEIIKGEGDVELFAREYYDIRIWAAPATISLTALTGWFIGMQNAKAPMVIAIAVNIINIVTSFIFVHYLDLKSSGVALGTVIGQYSGFILGIIVLATRYKKYIKDLRLSILFRIDGIKRFFTVNIDIFIRTLAVILVLTSYNFISAEKGELVLGINVIFLQLVFAFSFFTDGFANAAEALVGKYFGKSNLDHLKLLIKHLFYWGIGIALIFTFLYGFAWKPIMHIYTNNQSIIEASSEYMGWIIAIPLISILTFIWDGVFLGATATAEQRNATIAAAILFFTTYKVFDKSMGNHALLLAQLVFFGMRGILQSFYYKSAIINRLIKNRKYDNTL